MALRTFVPLDFVLSYDTEQPRRRDQHPHHELSVSASAGSAQTPAPNPNPQREEWREESDLEAQWETALWTKMAAMLAGLGTVVAIVGVLFVRDTLNATREANRVAQRERGFGFISHRHSGLFGFLLLGQEITWDRINDPEISYDRRVEKRS